MEVALVVDGVASGGGHGLEKVDVVASTVIGERLLRCTYVPIVEHGLNRSKKEGRR